MAPAKALLADVRRLLAEHIAQLQAHGLVPATIQPLPMAALLVAVAYGIAVQISVDETAPAPTAVASELASLLVRAQGETS